MKKKITIFGHIHPDAMAMAETRDDVEIHMVDQIFADRDVIIEACADTHAIGARSTTFDRELISGMKNLEIISRHGVGCDSVDVDYMSERGLPVAIAAGGNNKSVAEHTIAMTMSLLRRLPDQTDAMREGDWDVRDRIRPIDLQEQTIFIIGYGRIGKSVAHLAHAFGMKVMAYDPYVNDFADYVDVAGTLEQGLAEADVVTIHTPKTEETDGILGADQIAMMKPDTILINNARGGLVVEAAVAEALHSGHLYGYGADVFEVEPLDPENPVLKAPNTVLTPHWSASSPQGMRAMGMIMMQNIFDCFDGKLRPEMVFNAKGLGL